MVAGFSLATIGFIVWVYLTAVNVKRSGQSLAKKMFNIRVVRANGEPVYRIAAPFGDEIIVVIASASPLFPDELPDTATDRDYLTSFRKSFLLQPKGGGGLRQIAAMALPIKTRAK